MADFTSLCLPTSRYGTAMSCQKTFEAGACFFFLNKISYLDRGQGVFV